MSKYEHMTDSDFIEHLESKLKDTSWNVGEIVELERRGMTIVEQNEKLSTALLKKRSEFTAAVNLALEPYSKQFEILSDSISSFKNLHLRNALTMNPKIENLLVSSPKIAQELVLQEVGKTLELSLLELRGIRRQSHRDWFQWSILISSLVAAITAVITFIWA
jgi:hypothetical protein